MAVLLIFLLWVAPLALGIWMGNKRGKLAAGILLPLFLGWIGVVIIACLSDRSSNIVIHNTNQTPQYLPPPPPDSYPYNTPPIAPPTTQWRTPQDIPLPPEKPVPPADNQQ